MNCPNCSSDIASPEGLPGERVCTKCGLVVDSPLIVRGFSQWNPEWHSNWSEKDPETLKEWLTTLRTVSCQLGIADFPYREEAARAIRKASPLLAQSQKFGKNKRATVAALMHLILREYNKNRPIKSIADQLSLDSTLVMKQAWALSGTIKTDNQIIQIQRKTAYDYLFENGGKMQISKDILTSAYDTLRTTRRKGGNPIALASGALYLACKTHKANITKEQIAKEFGISPRTVDTNDRNIRRLIEATKKEQPQTIPAIMVISWEKQTAK